MEWRAVVLLFVAAAVLALADAQKKCSEIDGNCVADGDCPKTLETDGACKGKLVCCKKGRKVVKQEVKGKPVIQERQEVKGKPVIQERQDNANCDRRPRCERNNGTCVERSCTSAETALAGGCRGNDCTCCVRGCIPRSRCNRRGGTCVKRQCDSNEKLIKNACKGKDTDCNCCAPQKNCKTFKKCSRLNGQCVPNGECKEPEQFQGGCSKGCVCCGTDCPARRRCKDRGGVCGKDDCGAGQREIPGGCKNKVCKCCTSGCTTTNRCKKWGGTCTQPGECKFDNVDGKGCKKKQGCVCCTEGCRPKARCEKRGGECIEGKCGSNMKEIKQGCGKSTCSCCAPVGGGCKESTKCANRGGTCVTASECDDKGAKRRGCGKGCVCCNEDNSGGVTCKKSTKCENKGGTCAKKADCDDQGAKRTGCGKGCVCCNADTGTSCTPNSNCPGECKKNCLASEFEVGNACSADCKCCVPFPTTCNASPNTCKGKCTDTRDCKDVDLLPNSSCDDIGCSCCLDCTREVNCTAQRGVCRQNCLNAESELPNGCTGFNCKCCVPPNVNCPDTPATCRGKCVDDRECGVNDRIVNSACTGEFCTCCIDCTELTNCTAERGVCRQTCLTGESEVENGCSGFNCKCCRPADETCPATPATCRGMCKDSRRCAAADRIANSTCTGDFCMCCIDCTPLNNCTAQRGVCKQTCAQGETEINNGCSGFGCKCCSPPPATCPATSTCQAQCVDSRQCEAANLIAGSTCTGENCVCCLECTAQPRCTAQRGVCKQTCAQGETEIDNGCSGTGCKCCSPPPATCPATSTCQGKCVDARQCDDVLTGSTCNGANCVCCRECTAQPNCTAQRGVCKQTCAQGETEINNGCSGTGCKCCSPPPATCPATSTCQGKCVDSRQCDDVLTGSTCNGANCVCCRDCEIQTNCSDRGGSCKQSCNANETVIPNGCTGTNCMCCMPNDNLAVCTANEANCQGTCMDALNCDQVIPGGTCNGTNCQCCRDCNPLQVCQDLNGECMHIPTGECPNGLIKIPNGCSGFECTCCVTTSGLLSCPASPSCPGRCRDARVCPVVITGTACNTDGCSCCLDCTDNSCTQNNGVCRQRGTCLDDETMLTGNECTGNRCACCQKNQP